MSDRRVALITGANKGLGLEIARQLAKQDIAVVIGSRDVGRGQQAETQLRCEGLDAKFVKLDVTSDADVGALPAFFEKNFGRLDILVANAGVAFWGAEGIEAFRKTFDVNVFGVVAVIETLLPLIKKSHAGRIVVQSSMLGSLGTIENAPPGMVQFVVPAYTASKAAINGYAVAMAIKLRGTHVKINAAHPGWVKTELGGDQAPMEIIDGAKTAVHLATLPEDGPSGKLIHFNVTQPW